MITATMTRRDATNIRRIHADLSQSPRHHGAGSGSDEVMTAESALVLFLCPVWKAVTGAALAGAAKEFLESRSCDASSTLRFRDNSARGCRRRKDDPA